MATNLPHPTVEAISPSFLNSSSCKNLTRSRLVVLAPSLLTYRAHPAVIGQFVGRRPVKPVFLTRSYPAILPFGASGASGAPLPDEMTSVPCRVLLIARMMDKRHSTVGCSQMDAHVASVAGAVLLDRADLASSITLPERAIPLLMHVISSSVAL